MIDFLRKNFATILTFISAMVTSVVVNVVVFVYNSGKLSSDVATAQKKVEEIESRVIDMDTHGSQALRSTQFTVDNHSKQIEEIRSDLKEVKQGVQKTQTDVAALNSDVHFLVEWLKQKEK